MFIAPDRYPPSSVWRGGTQRERYHLGIYSAPPNSAPVLSSRVAINIHPRQGEAWSSKIGLPFEIFLELLSALLKTHGVPYSILTLRKKEIARATVPSPWTCSSASGS